MHLCLPQFGPSKTDDHLPHHGFGRTEIWDVIQSDEHSCRMRLNHTHPNYADIVWTVEYTLLDDAARFTLQADNQGTTTVFISPGFHPYFHCPHQQASLDQQDLAWENLENVLFRSAFSTYTCQNFSLRIEQTNLPVFAIWTDSLADYLCIEPTFAGDACDNLSKMHPLPAQSQTAFSLTISLN